MDQRNALGRAFNGMTVLVGYEIPLRRIGAGLFPANAEFPAVAVQRHLRRRQPPRLRGRARRSTSARASTTLLAGTDPALAAEVAAAFERADAALARARRALRPLPRAAAPAAPSAPTAEAAVRALTDLGRDLRQAGNRLGVLVVVPGL